MNSVFLFFLGSKTFSRIYSSNLKKKWKIINFNRNEVILKILLIRTHGIPIVMYEEDRILFIKVIRHIDHQQHLLIIIAQNTYDRFFAIPDFEIQNE